MRGEPGFRDSVHGIDRWRQAAADDEVVVLLGPACAVRGSMDDPTDELEEAGGSKLLGSGVEIPSQDPRPLQQAKPPSNLIKDGEVAGVGGPDDVVEVNRPKMQPAFAYRSHPP